MTAYDTALLALSGVQGYWPLDDTIGSTSLRDATAGPIGAIPFVTSFAGVTLGSLGNPSILPGDASTCVHATGAASWQLSWGSISPTGQAAIQQPGPVSILAWVQPDQVTGNTNNDQFIFGQWNASMLDLKARTVRGIFTGALDLDSPNAMLPNSPAMLAVTYDRAHVNIYVNGVLVKTGAATAAVSASTNNLELAGILGAAGFQGFIQKVALLSTSVPQATVQSLYQIGAQTAAEAAGKNLNVYPFSRQALAANAGRVSVTFTNISDTPMFLALGDTGTPAVPLRGIRLAPNGGEWSSGTWKGPVQAIHSNWLGTKLLLIEEH